MSSIDKSQRKYQWGEILEVINHSFKKDGKIISVRDILQDRNISYSVFKPSEKIQDMRAAYDHDNNSILVNETISDEDKHFVIAHEVGHSVLHPESNYVDYFTKNSGKVARETEANMFAYELLMPILVFIDKYQEFDKNLKKIAEHFFVEERRVVKRLDFLMARGFI